VDAAVDSSASDAAALDAAPDAPLPDAAAEASPADAAEPDAGATVRVRIVAANITSDNYQSYELPGIRIFQGLAPDIVMVQEFKYRHGTLRDLVDTAFGTSFCFYREAQVGGIPNGVVSRYPITGYGEWQDQSVPDRDFVWARIDVPGPIDLWAVSVHMKTSTTTTRAQEAKDLVADIQAQVPAGGYLVVGGDLNTGSTTELAVGELSSVVVTNGTRPADQNGNDRTNANRNKPYDWVLPNAALAQRELPVAIGASSYASGLVFDSRVYTPLSEVAPVQAGDSGVNGMQHMAVIKDFALPTGP
jgi:endonuclease/exonuclease/phosphatase family metal-dependent hydrolase